MRFRPALVALSLVTLVVPALAVVAAPSARAASTFTWTGVKSEAWGNPENWTPSDRAPQDGDSVSIGPSPRNPTGVPDISLAMLSVTGSPDTAVNLSGEGEIITQQLLWQGGDIDVDLVVGGLGAPPSLISPMQTPLRFGAGGDQTLKIIGHLSLAAGLAAGSGPWLTLMFDSSIEVANTGTLALDPAASLQANRCCGEGTSTLRVDGTVEVFSITGATGLTARLDQLGLDLGGDFVVPEGNTVDLVGGPVRAGSAPLSATQGGGSISGGGTFRVVETDGDSFDPADPLAPDSTLKLLDDLVLADGTVLELGQHAEVSGAHRIAGDGSVRLAGATVYGEVGLAPSVPVTVVAGPPTRIVALDDVEGRRGVLTPGGGLRVESGATLSVHGGARLLVPSGARASLPAGSVLTSDGCCTNPGKVTVQQGAVLAIGGGSGDPTVLRWVELGGAGHVNHARTSQWDLPRTAFAPGATFTGGGRIEGDLAVGPSKITPIGVLTVDGDYSSSAGGTYVATLPGSSSGTVAQGRLVVTGTARLAGSVIARGNTQFPTGRQVVALQAGSVSGAFVCAAAPGLLLDHTPRTVVLTAFPLRTSGCLAPLPGRLVDATFSGARGYRLGVPASAERVVLRVELGTGPRANSVTLSAGGTTVRVDAGARRGQSRYVVLPLAGSRRLTARLERRAHLTVERVGWL